MDAQSVMYIARWKPVTTHRMPSPALFGNGSGQLPSPFRKSPDWKPWLAAFGSLDNARSKLMQKTFTSDAVMIRDVPPTPVAIMEHRGDPATLGATIQRFIAWRKAAGLSKTGPTFNVWRSAGHAPAASPSQSHVSDFHNTALARPCYLGRRSDRAFSFMDRYGPKLCRGTRCLEPAGRRACQSHEWTPRLSGM
jgi:GyrI-like small molecule binding domain